MEPFPKKQRRASLKLLHPLQKAASFGAEVEGIDLASVDEEELGLIKAALSEHLVLVIRGQGAVDPTDIVAFTRQFDPEAKSVWRDQATNPWERYKADNMGPAGTFQLPAPRQETLVIGK